MFLTRLCLLEDPQPDFWVVGSPLIWDNVTVPIGARTDLASIPRILRNVPELDPDGVSRSGAVLHDWLYRTHQFTRAQSDSILRAALLARGASKSQAWAFYAGVRIGGYGAYADHPHGPTAADFDTQANFDAWRFSNSGIHGY